MGKPKIKACKICGATDKPLSTRKLCIDCGVQRQILAARQIRNKSGAFYELWLIGLAKAAAKGLSEVERRDRLLPEADPKTKKSE